MSEIDAPLHQQLLERYGIIPYDRCEIDMKAVSTSTLVSDPYRAGVMLGEVLQNIHPEIVLLFGSLHSAQNTELLEGLYDTLANDEPIVIGCSGDGFYEASRISDQGVAALGLNSEGKVKWQIATASGIGAEPMKTTQSAIASLRQKMQEMPLALVFLFSDFRADASQIEHVIRDEIEVPVVGGFAADDNRMATCFLFYNREILQDSVVLLGASGDLKFDISVANNLIPVGRAGLIQAAEATRIQDIDGIGAMDFIERETGKPVLQTDRGVVALMVIDPDYPILKRLRSIVPNFGEHQATLGLFGGIEVGKRVQVCLASPQLLIDDVQTIAQHATTLDFKPVAALVISCIGRKQLLGREVENEISALADAFPEGLPLVGFPAFGEIGPLRINKRYGPNMFHNMTYVLLSIGA